MRCKDCGKAVGRSDGKKQKLCNSCYNKNLKMSKNNTEV